MKLHRAWIVLIVVAVLSAAFLVSFLTDSEGRERSALARSGEEPSRPGSELTELARPDVSASDAPADESRVPSAVGRSAQPQPTAAPRPTSLRIFGSVSEQSFQGGRAPVQGARVVLDVLDVTLVLDLEQTSATGGGYTFDFPLDREASAGALLRVAVDATGHARETKTYPLARALKQNQEEGLRLDFELGRPVPQFRGRVLDADGGLVAGASVLGFGEDGSTIVLRTTTGQDGSYALEAPRVDEVWLTAHHFGHGVGRLFEPVELTGAHGEAPDIYLKRGELLGGQVRLPNGDPAVGVRLRAHPADSASLPGSGSTFGIHPPQRALELDGLPCAWAESDEQGKFAFRGLSIGAYSIEPGGEDLSLAEGSEGPFEAGETELELVVVTYRVIVRADAGESPVRIVCRSWQDPAPDLLGAIHSGSAAHERSRRPEEVRNASFLSRVCDLSVGAGEVLHFEASAPGFRSASTVLEVDEGVYHYELDLALSPLSD